MSTIFRFAKLLTRYRYNSISVIPVYKHQPVLNLTAYSRRSITNEYDGTVEPRTSSIVEPFILKQTFWEKYGATFVIGSTTMIVLYSVFSIVNYLFDWRFSRGRVNNRDILTTCVDTAFSDSKPFACNGDEIDRTSTDSAQIMKLFFTPQHRVVHSPGPAYRSGYYILSGSKGEGKSILARQIYNVIKTKDPNAPIIYINMEGGLRKFSAAINAFLPETIRPYSHNLNTYQTFKKALLRLGDSLEKRELDRKIPVLVIDAFKDIPTDAFTSLVGTTKALIDQDNLKVVFLASDERSILMVHKNRDVMSRTMKQHRIENDFEPQAVAEYVSKVFGRPNTNEDKQLSDILWRMTGGRISFVKDCVNDLPIDILAKGEDATKEMMLSVLFDKLIGNIDAAFRKLTEQGIPTEHVLSLIDADLPSKVLSLPPGIIHEVIRILVLYNIIRTKVPVGGEYVVLFKNKPLELIFGREKYRKRIAAPVSLGRQSNV